MNFLRSICCMFGGQCDPEQAKPADTMRAEADLGQTEADLEKTGKERMSHLEGAQAPKPRKPR